MSEPYTLHQFFIGKNTLETARILAEMFTARFGKQWGTREDILLSLLPGGRANTWGDLDKRITIFAKKFYERDKGRNEEHSEQIVFLDKIRFTLQGLPQRQDYSLPEGKEDYPTPLEAAYHFVTCALCWRTVARQPLEKKTPLCHVHDLPSSSPAYRRRARMKPQVDVIRLRLVKALPTLWELRRDKNVNLQSYLQGLCLGLDSPLPHLVQYLRSLGRPPLALPLRTGRDILNALEYPVYLHKLPLRVREAWDCFLDDRSQHFKLNYIQILTAEAWLQADVERQHGGKRR